MTREEAIKQLKKWSLPKETMELLEALSPGLTNELRESEDERMKKAIVHILYENYSDAAVIEGVEIAEIVAWLEKQKGKMTAEEFESSELFQLKLKTKYADGYQDGLAQKEQKQEWNEEDDACYETIKGILEDNLTEEDKPEYVLSWFNLHCFRPSWKPSELEKGALRTAIHILTEERSFPKAAAQLQNILDAFE